MLNSVIQQLLASSFLDIAGFVLSLIYVILASKKIIWCWIFAFGSSLIYIYLCFFTKLYIDSILQLFYAVMAVYGWVQWRKREELLTEIQHYSLFKHALNIIILSGLCFIIGFLFASFTDQAYPYIDSFIFVFSIFATYLITKNIIENWLYFIVIDAISVPVYWGRGLSLMSVLFVIYSLISIFAYYSWYKMAKHD